ncbi:High-affinity branched-chain amino acid transport system permease protein LivH (TC 3.A.1.4.1) [hydrothermal vent metagenome]|uniref:High-affinity branched-chain amino acid transport system permease protein LivH (TC 3.A.1.4.1) n=1 Tax=hydrothermal vent metagenome TaxID=652676 RepID=A0A3B0TA64_9ZZZZ
MLYLELLVQGIVQGSIYALIALGLTLVYGLLRILHVAHAALFTLGGYIGVIVTNATGSLVLAMFLAAVIVGFVGMAVYKIAYEPLLGQPPYIALIASIALFIAAEELFRIIFGPYGLSYATPPLSGQIELFGGFLLKYAELLVIGLSVVMLSGLGWLSLNTRLGVAWRATVTDPDMARAFGINTQNVRYLNFFIGSALAAIAGVLVALLNNLVEPTMGSVPSYKALAIIVLGGLGSIRGTLLASMLLGVIEAFGTIYIGHLMDRDALAFAFLIIVLMVRPQGLLGAK